MVLADLGHAILAEDTFALAADLPLDAVLDAIAAAVAAVLATAGCPRSG